MKRYALFALAVLLSTAARCPAPHPPSPPPPPPQFRLQVYVHDADDRPLVTARVYRDNVDSENPFKGGTPRPVGTDAGIAWTLPPQDFNVCAGDDGYEPQCLPVPLYQSLTLTAKLVKRPTPPPPDITPITYPPPARDPLTRFPEIRPDDGAHRGFWSFEDYDRGLVVDPPDRPSPDYLRGNFGAMPFPECQLPPVSGGYADRPHLAMSWFLPLYDAPHQVCVLQGHQRRSYTHIGSYFPWAKNQGVSDAAFDDLLRRVHRAGLWNVVTLFGGDGETWDYVRDHLDQWYASGALRAGDVLVTCWQCDGKYDPYPLAEITVQIAAWAHPKGLTVAQHWYSGRIAWWDADDSPRSPSTCVPADAARLGLRPFCNRGEFARAFDGIVDWEFQQFDPWAPLADERPRQGGTRGELRDSLRALRGTRTKLVVAEYDAQRVEDQNAPEVEGDALGYLLLSVRDDQGHGADGGFFNGARLPSGEWLH